MKIKILIAGGGQLGSRYLQGLSNYKDQLDIFIYDISDNSLEQCSKRWEESNPLSSNSATFLKSLFNIPQQLDLVIVATTANVRSSLVREISSRFEVKHWILEKILAQSISQLDSLREQLENHNSAWINTPMHIWPLYKLVKKNSKKQFPLKAEFSGFSGLLCNAIHYIDLINRWNNSSILSINADGLNGNWFTSKRGDFIETEGEIEIIYEDKSTLNLKSYKENLGLKAEIKIDDMRWIIDENKSIAINNFGKKINASTMLQSEMTGIVVKDILNNKKVNLPTFNQSYNQHKLFLSSVIDQRNKSLIKKVYTLNIT